MHRLLLCLAAVLVAVTAGCAREPARDVVLARVGVEARPALAEPPQTAKPRRFGTHTRNAVPATRDGFEVEVPAHATRLAFSVSGGKAGVAARFEVSQRSAPDAAWQPFIEVESNEAAWRDHEFALSAGAERVEADEQDVRPRD